MKHGIGTMVSSRIFLWDPGTTTIAVYSTRGGWWRELETQNPPSQDCEETAYAADGYEGKDHRAGLRLTAEIPFSAFLRKGWEAWSHDHDHE